MADNQDKLVSISSGHKTMVIEVYPGYNTAQIIALLNMREAMVQGDEIVSWPEPPSEGFYPMCKILEQNDETEHGKWDVFEETDHAQCCAVLSPEERDRNFATNLINHAHALVGEQQLTAAQALIDAASALLDVHGGPNCEAGIWLLTAQGSLISKREDHQQAVPFFEQAHDLARALLGEEHPAHAVTQSNLGETLIGAGRPEAGRLLLQAARRQLDSTAPSDNYDAEYIQFVIANIDGVLAKSAS